MIKKFEEFIEESSEIDRLAVGYFGTTNNFNICGCVMRDLDRYFESSSNR